MKDMLMQKRHSLAMLVAAAGAVTALMNAPLAAADENGGGSAGNPLLPGCETTGGSAVTGGQETDCAEPGNSQLTATPNDIGIMGEEADEPVFGMYGW
jgi:hypothetical protein